MSRYWEGLPEWLTELLQEYIAYRQRRWKPSQVRNHTRARLNTLRRVWRWLLDEEQVGGIADLQRAHVQDFIKARLAADIRSGTVNAELTDLWAFFGSVHGTPFARATSQSHSCRREGWKRHRDVGRRDSYPGREFLKKF